ncbi:protein-tyrosine phosphatase-like protein, partial [Cokeromyces recurvatus]|uniref:protein-tyrosine phosphatase-like protein n=1 Tax=Cokeromyces recurvatus TaxID=90255 RepID=UPI0022212503
ISRSITTINHPSYPIRFLILDSPTESSLPAYLNEFIHLNVSTVVRCCQPTYNSQILLQRGISVIDLPFKDGSIPPPQVVHQWLNCINKAKLSIETQKQQQQQQYQQQQRLTIAVHCIAGLGRAPVLVAIALIELGMSPLDAMGYVREKRRGSFNKSQISFLDEY